MGADDMRNAGLVIRAAAVAAAAHAGQRRTGLSEPYINHPLRVAYAACKHGHDAQAVAAAVLHDVLEHTKASRIDLACDFPPVVVRLVARLTKWWASDATPEDKAVNTPLYYEHIAADPVALDLTLLDRADNLTDLVRMLDALATPDSASSPGDVGDFGQHYRWAVRYATATRADFGPLVPRVTNVGIVTDFTHALDVMEQAIDRYVGTGGSDHR